MLAPARNEVHCLGKREREPVLESFGGLKSLDSGSLTISKKNPPSIIFGVQQEVAADDGHTDGDYGED